MADEYLPKIVFTVEETAARREAEQLQVSQSISTETVEKLQPGGKPTVSEQAMHATRRQQEKQRPDKNKDQRPTAAARDG